MEIRKKIAQRKNNRKTRYDLVYNSFFVKFARAWRLYLFVNEKCPDLDLKNEAAQQTLTSITTGFEVFCRDLFERKVAGLQEDVWLAQLMKNCDPNLKKQITDIRNAHSKKYEQCRSSFRDYFSAKFNFQNFAAVLTIFSALTESDFPKKIGVPKEVLTAIADAWELRHRLTHDVNIMMVLSEDRLRAYAEAMRHFAQYASWKG